MKKIGVLTLAASMSLMAWGQTMKIHTGAVTVAVPATEAGKMVYGAGGTTLTIMGKTYAVNEIDSITVDRSVVAPNTVGVQYQGTQARVLLAGNIAPQMTATVKGADVRLVSDAALQQEVFYTLQGSSADGSFFMDGEFKAAVTLDNLNLSNNDGAAIDIANGKRIDIILPEGTTTTLSDGVGGTHKACFFVNGHAELKGAGTLVLTGNTKHAFASDEYTSIRSSFGKLKVLKAEGDGLHIEQYFQMRGGYVEIAHTKGDGIDVSVTKDPKDERNGEVMIENGRLKVTVASDDTKGVKSASHMTISGGAVEAGVIGNGTKGLSVGGNLSITEPAGNTTTVTMAVTGGTYMPDDPVKESKCRGIKVKGNFTFDGGKIDILADKAGKKNKSISIDGIFRYIRGDRNCIVYTPDGDY